VVVRMTPSGRARNGRIGFFVGVRMRGRSSRRRIGVMMIAAVVAITAELRNDKDEDILDDVIDSKC
jgi:hypothetical protein